MGFKSLALSHESHLELSCEYELWVSKDRGKNCIKVRLLLICHLLCDHLFQECKDSNFFQPAQVYHSKSLDELLAILNLG